MLTSILSYPDRGKWGNSKYRGNCSGYVIKELLEYFKPQKFVEVFAGGGTGKDVAVELGITNSEHLDLNPVWGGWDALKDEMPIGSDFVFSHPPYHDIVPYSGSVWGKEAHPDDLSHCPTYEDFIKKIDIVNAKIYSTLTGGGRMAILVGDIRRKGQYFSIIKDMAWYGTIESHIIKEQHNMVSNRKNYSGNFIPILHEHLLIFKKEKLWLIPMKITRNLSKDFRDSEFPTWRDLVQFSLQQLGGKGRLNEIYEIVGSSVKTKTNSNWQAKVRQTLQINKQFHSSERGVWEYKLVA